MGIGISQLSIRELSRKKVAWDGTPTFIDLATDKEHHLKFVGFCDQESWGIWSKQQECYVLLPTSVHGACEIQIFAQTFGQNKGREICLTLGDSQVRFIAEEEPRQYIFRFNPTQLSNLLIINGLAPESTPTDPRTLGIGIHRLQMTRPADTKPISLNQSTTPQIKKRPKVKKKLKLETHSLNKRDEVYSALFSEESKNNEWRDLVSA
jgi:hypothetical protein